MRASNRQARGGAIRLFGYLSFVPFFVLTAGCGGSPSGTGMGPTDVARARVSLERYRHIPRFTQPGPQFNAKVALKGKTIFEIPVSSEVPFVAAVERGMKQAAAVVGAKLVVFPNQGSPTEWQQGISAAIARHADAITLFAQNPALLGPQIAQATKAGTPVIVLRTTGDGDACQSDPNGKIYGTACVPGPFEQAGRLIADHVVEATNGKANALVITSSEAPSSVPLMRGLRDEFRRRCPPCRVTTVDVPIVEWATRIPTEVQSRLVGDPKIDYIIPIYDSMSQFVVAAIRTARADGRVKVATFNGTPFVLKMVEDGDVVAMDVGENLSWLGWAAMDQAFRVVAGVSPVKSEHTALRVFDDGNVAAAGRPPGYDAGYGSSYIEGYKRLWRVGN